MGPWPRFQLFKKRDALGVDLCARSSASKPQFGGGAHPLRTLLLSELTDFFTGEHDRGASGPPCAPGPGRRARRVSQPSHSPATRQQRPPHHPIPHVSSASVATAAASARISSRSMRRQAAKMRQQSTSARAEACESTSSRPCVSLATASSLSAAPTWRLPSASRASLLGAALGAAAGLLRPPRPAGKSPRLDCRSGCPACRRPCI